jgi:monovalent cation/hydrogen antiporter
MAAMSDIEFLLGLLAVVAVIVWAARASGLPYPIFLVLGGLALGAIPGLPDITLDPDVVFLVFLPPLLHAAAYRSSPKRLRAEATGITLLAFALVGATIAAVAVVAHALIDGLPWEAAVVLGAIVAPTDAVAATAVFRRLGAPERVVTIVEGESLVNDATALVVFRLAVAAAVTGSFSLGEGVVELLLVGSGGVAAGLVVAWVVGELRRRLDDSLIEITLTLLTPYVAYIVAEELGASGILAAVSSGLYLGAKASELLSPTTRLEAYAFWGVLTFLLESTLFVLVGLQFPGVLDRLGGSDPGDLAVQAAAVVAVVVVVRMAFSLVIPLGRALSLRHRVVIGWAGMRGAVSLAAALSVPLATDAGAAFPQRDLLVFLTLSVIVATLVVQGLTLPLLLRGAEDEETPEEGPLKALVRFRTVQAALARIGDLGLADDAPAGALDRARSLYAQRARQLADDCRTGVAESDSDVAAWLELRRELLGVERRELFQLRDDGEVPARLALELERDLDLEESRLAARQAVA